MVNSIGSSARVAKWSISKSVKLATNAYAWPKGIGLMTSCDLAVMELIYIPVNSGEFHATE